MARQTNCKLCYIYLLVKIIYLLLTLKADLNLINVKIFLSNRKKKKQKKTDTCKFNYKNYLKIQMTLMIKLNLKLI